MKTYECNMADQALIVKSLKVLENIDGGGIREIRQSVEAVQKNAIAMVKQQDEYWKDLSADGVISAVEKQGLKREMENIRQSYSAVTQQAASFGYTNPILQDYVRTYEKLRSYLYDTLKLFDNMSEDTPIEDREYFNTLFSNYFFLENFILLAITKGVLDTLQFRVLESLNEPGEEGETGLYHGGLYQYTDGRWKSVTTGAYKGARSELPGEEEDAFFLVSETFVMTDTLIVNDTELLVNGDTLGITHSYFKGYIYYCQNGIWNIEEDKTNWRYAAAFADVINVTGELPQIFQDSIDDLQQQIDAQYAILHGDIVEVSQEIEGKVFKYLGGKNTVPVNPNEGDFFTWTGGNADPWYKGKVYQRRNGAWDMLDPTESANRSYYMMALQDVLATSVTGEGYFSTIFANAFFANDATLQSLSTRTIYLRQGGYIQSDNTGYIAQTQGLRIDYDGNIDANQNTHIKGKVAIGVPLTGNSDFNTYDVVIGGNALIKGDSKFSGAIDTDKECFAAGFELRGLKPGRISLKKMNCENATNSWMIPASGTISFHGIASYTGNGGYLAVYKNGVELYMWHINSHSTDNYYFSINNNYYFSINVEAGDIIKIDAHGQSGGAQGGTVTFLGGLYSSTRNSLVSFLGQTVYENNPPSPVR